MKYLFLFLLLLSCSAPQQPFPEARLQYDDSPRRESTDWKVQWHKPSQDTADKAVQERKFILFFFQPMNTECPACEKLYINLNDPSNANFINENFVPIFINDPEGLVLSKFQDNPLQYPTLMITDWNGKILSQRVGPATPQAIRRYLNDAVKLRSRL